MDVSSTGGAGRRRARPGCRLAEAGTARHQGGASRLGCRRRPSRSRGGRGRRPCPCRARTARLGCGSAASAPVARSCADPRTPIAAAAPAARSSLWCARPRPPLASPGTSRRAAARASGRPSTRAAAAPPSAAAAAAALRFAREGRRSGAPPEGDGKKTPLRCGVVRGKGQVGGAGPDLLRQRAVRRVELVVRWRRLTSLAPRRLAPLLAPRGVRPRPAAAEAALAVRLHLWRGVTKRGHEPDRGL